MKVQTAQLNIRISKPIKAQLLKAIQSGPIRISQTAAMERGIELVIAELEGKK